MPRSQKNKQRRKNKSHNQKKGPHEGDDSQDNKGAQKSAAVEEKPPSSSSAVIERITEKLPASESSSDTEWPSCIPSPVAISDDDKALDKGNYCCCGRNLVSSEYQPCCDNACKNCLEMYVTLVEQTVLYKYKMKQPVTRKDLLNVINPKYLYKFDEIFKRASENIEIAFSVNVVEIDPDNHIYDVVSKLELPNKGRVCPGRGFPKTGLLLTMLAMILMKGTSVDEEEVWKFLNIMQVYPGRKHFIYREPRKLITQDFVKLKYLEYQQIPNSDPPRYEFLWGPKACTESTKMKVLEFMSKGTSTKPSIFSVVCSSTLREEAQKSKENAGSSPGTKARARAKPSPNT